MSNVDCTSGPSGRLPFCPQKLPLSTRRPGESSAPTPRRTIAVGQNSREPPRPHPLSSSIPENIPLYRNSDLSYKRNTLTRDKGRIAIVTNRGLGCDGRDGVGRERHCRAALAVSNCLRANDTTLTASSHGREGEHTPAVEDACEDVRGRRSRVVLTPGACASSLAVMWVVRPGAHISHPQDDGGNSASLPGESTKDTVKTIAQGRPGDRHHL